MISRDEIEKEFTLAHGERPERLALGGEDSVNFAMRVYEKAYKRAIDDVAEYLDSRNQNCQGTRSLAKDIRALKDKSNFSQSMIGEKRE